VDTTPLPPSPADRSSREPARPSLRESLVAISRDLLAPIALATVAAFALLPTPRAAAWIGLLALCTTLGVIARPMGVTAAVASAMAFMAVHGRPRFASTITDVWTIRASFLLGILGASAAAASSWWASQRQQRSTGQPEHDRWTRSRPLEHASPRSDLAPLTTRDARRTA
jgi:hypothetical protein